MRARSGAGANRAVAALSPELRSRYASPVCSGVALVKFLMPMVLIAAGLAGCNDPRDCALGIAHRDCYPEGSTLALYPQDDAICRSFRLVPGTHDYKVCRDQKRHERLLTERATDFGVLEEPLAPDVRPVYQVP